MKTIDVPDRLGCRVSVDRGDVHVDRARYTNRTGLGGRVRRLKSRLIRMFVGGDVGERDSGLRHLPVFQYY